MNMIDKHELRLGNMIAIDGASVVVNELREFDLVSRSNEGVYTSCNYDLYNPIPITPEWLERLGFEKSGNEWVWDERIWVRPEDDDWGDEMWLDTYHRWNSQYPNEPYQKVYVGTNPRYVHLLQNLVFAMTDTELIITP